MVLNENRGFFVAMGRRFEYTVISLLKTWIRLNLMMTTKNEQLKFLLRCRRYDVLPTCLNYMRLKHHFCSRSATKKYSQFTIKTKIWLLNLEISDANVDLQFLSNRLGDIEARLKSLIPNDIFTYFVQTNTNRILRQTKDKNKTF